MFDGELLWKVLDEEVLVENVGWKICGGMTKAELARCIGN